jgi:hypothetical protein
MPLRPPQAAINSFTENDSEFMRYAMIKKFWPQTMEGWDEK